MKIKLSILASFALITTMQADSIGLEKALTSGKISGDLTLFAQDIDKNGTNKNTGYSMGSIGVNYESESFHNFKTSLGFRANHDFDEKNSGDYSDGNEPKAILNIANISYENEYVSFILGRQGLSYEWLGDYHEALVAIIKPFEKTEITLAHSNRTGAADNDGALVDFKKINKDDGVNFLDIKYCALESLNVNSYYYNLENIANWYGVKIDFNKESFGATVHYAKSDEDLKKDGDILHLEARANFKDLAIKTGYINTDKEVGAGSMTTFDDNISPLGDGNQVYEVDANTTYLGLTYPIYNFEFESIYGETKYSSDNKKEKEFDLVANYSFNKNTKITATFRQIKANRSDDDYNKFKILASYTF